MSVRASPPASAEPRRAPGPGVIGLATRLLRVRRDPIGVLMEDARRFGDVVRYRFGLDEVLLIRHPAHIHHIFVRNDRNYWRGPLYDPVRHVTSDSLLTTDGAEWNKRRRLMSPAFSRRRLAMLSETMVEEIEWLLKRWERFAHAGQSLNVAAEMYPLTQRIVGRALFGSDLSGQVETITGAVNDLRLDVDRRSMNVFTLPDWIPTRGSLRYRRGSANLDRVVYAIIRDRRQREARKEDLLSMMMEARDEETGEVLSDSDLRNEIALILVAGHETTAALLGWTLHLLHRHPEVLACLDEEIERVLAGRRPCFDDLKSLPYSSRVIREVLRLFPPAWIIDRRAVEDDAVGAYAIPAGAAVVLSAYVTHRHPEFWPEPERFDPDRFLREAVAARPAEAYVPFGAGPRTCIGSQFALTEAQLVLASLLQRFRIRVHEGQEPGMEPSVALRLRKGLMASLEVRS